MKIDLGGQYNVFSLYIAPNRLSEIFLARPCRIDVGSIKKIDSQIACLTIFFTFPWVQRPYMHLARWVSKAHTTDAKARDPNA